MGLPEGRDAAADPGGSLLEGLVENSHLVAPDELPSLVARAAEAIEASEVVVYLVGYEQRVLTPLAGEGVPPREPLEVDHTLGGWAFRTVTVLRSGADDGERLWVPMVDGTARVGVMELTLAAVDDALEQRVRAFAGLVATLVVTKDAYGDTLKLARRAEPMSVAAEMQWELLPPLTFSDGRVTISGMLEPSYRVAGDTFDYALNDGCLHVAVIDAMGHGFEATVLATVAIGVYRHARRLGQGLAETYRAMDDAIVRQFGVDRFVTGQLVELDTRTGLMRWLNAGHPKPLLTRGNTLVGPLECAPTLPIGFGGAVAEIAEHQLQPGDRLVFVTDGVLEARSADGEFFGENRLEDFVVRVTTAGLPAPETARRLTHAVLDHQDGQLQDDATTVFVEWVGRERALPVGQAPPPTPSG
ncbi:MAG TPA: PP2C family protein-serine/threonine phosphatase [Egibacteraceae bacterium]|nr:PP2C family protein-serine/threonine phosphatase [Egibacteraceae bacterium]